MAENHQPVQPTSPALFQTKQSKTVEWRNTHVQCS